jgi:hypothetical protein
LGCSHTGDKIRAMLIKINDKKNQKLKCDECEYSCGQQFGNEETQKLQT